MDVDVERGCIFIILRAKENYDSKKVHSAQEPPNCEQTGWSLTQPWILAGFISGTIFSQSLLVKL